jgi:hypothetical protein
VTDDGQHGEHRLHQHTVLPLAARTHEVITICGILHLP